MFLDVIWQSIARWKSIMLQHYKLLNSYLNHIRFQVLHKTDTSNLYSLTSGVPPGSVFCPISLSSVYVWHFSSDIITAIFAKDTALLNSDNNPKISTITSFKHTLRTFKSGPDVVELKLMKPNLHILHSQLEQNRIHQ